MQMPFFLFLPPKDGVDGQLAFPQLFFKNCYRREICGFDFLKKPSLDVGLRRECICTSQCMGNLVCHGAWWLEVRRLKEIAVDSARARSLFVHEVM